MLDRQAPDPDSDSDLSALLGPALASALAKKGYATLTPVQKSVLEPALAGRDLRISSQTGSGKTLALGFVLRSVFGDEPAPAVHAAPPRALVIAPTRELAKQVQSELGWLYAPLKVGVAAVTGGSSYRDEHRALVRGPGIVVGTPGRLLDHLNRGSVDASQVTAVVLDEADRMLELGFREELEAILAKLPPEHRTHLVSATFAREVKGLADRVQKNAVNVEGTPLGTANVDIEHVIYLVRNEQKLSALVNLLLADPDERTLIFARTRADVSTITHELGLAGFPVDSLSGEMQQEARTRALSAFRRGDTRVLVATDVAGRGIDVQDVTRVIQVDPPTDPDTYTHRSGRTGRAGRKGTSALLVAPNTYKRTLSLLSRVGVRYKIQPVPTADAIRAAEDERTFAELAKEVEGDIPDRIQKQVQKLVEGGFAERALSRLLARVRPAGAEPRDVSSISPEPERRRADARSPQRKFEGGPSRYDAFLDDGPPRGRAPGGARGRASNDEWMPFRISFGEEQGADARRLVAMLCRRGGIRGADIGAIRVQRDSSIVEIAAHVADGFRDATSAPDPRDPDVLIAPLGAAPQRHAPSQHPSSPPPASGRPFEDRRPKARETGAFEERRPPARETGAFEERRPPAREAGGFEERRPPVSEGRPFEDRRPPAHAGRPFEDRRPPARDGRVFEDRRPPAREGRPFEDRRPAREGNPAFAGKPPFADRRPTGPEAGEKRPAYNRPAKEGRFPPKARAGHAPKANRPSPVPGSARPEAGGSIPRRARRA